MTTNYIPVIAACVAAILGYFFGQRTKKHDRVIQFSLDSVKEIYSPMYHELKDITHSSLPPKERELKIDAFFLKHLSSNTQIYKLGNVEIFDLFYELSNKYMAFKESRDENIWRDFWVSFENEFYFRIKDEYDNLTNLIYHEFKWQQFILNKPYWLKSYYEVMRFLLETFKGILVVLALIAYFTGAFELFKIGLFPKDTFKLCTLLFFMSSVIFTILVMLNLQYINLSAKKRKNSFSRNFMKKFLPRFLTWWDNFLMQKGNNDLSKVPKMFDKKDVNL